MAFLFGRNRSKTNVADLPKLAKDIIPKVDDPNSPKAEELAKVLSQMKYTLQGTQEVEANPDQVSQLVSALVAEDLLFIFASNINKFSFEGRKDTQVILSYVFRYKAPSSPDPVVLNQVLSNRPEIIIELCNGYATAEGSGPCGTVLREILKYNSVAELILYDEPGQPAMSWDPNQPTTGKGVFWKFFTWIDQGAFETSADAFTTFREILIKHKDLIPPYLTTNFDRFFSLYNSLLLNSDSYVTKRQSIKLLGEILLDRSNYAVMTAYVAEGENLKLCMQLLRDHRRMVQYEGFHVFKVFVANPNKSPAVLKILITNKHRLLNFLPQFLEDRTEDEQFLDERAFLVRQIEGLPDQVDPGTSLPPSSSTPTSTSTPTSRAGSQDGIGVVAGS